MEAYTGFASVYDMFMDNIPYDDWTAYLISLLREYQISDGLVLDLGCGTGSVTERLAAGGYDMIGVDRSEEMLQLAQEKRIESGQDILYLLQDMREFELYGTVRAVVSICDSMNYILEKEDLQTVFRLVNNYLDPHGIFIFDLNTEYKYKTLLGDSVIAENREESAFIWENTYHPDERINEYDLTLFIQEEDDCYRRYQETHYQKAYRLSEITDAILASGMELLAVYDAFTREPAKEDSERIYVIAREQGKTEGEKK